MPTVLKNFAADVTAKADDETPGNFSALVAVFGNVDSQGDVIDKGAFDDTLNAWKTSGKPIPIVWSHDWDDPFSHIGGVDPSLATETDDGLLVQGSLDLDNPTGAQVYKLMKSGRVGQFSFAATTADGGWTLTEGDDGSVVQHLTKLNLIEVGPTLRGANTETHLVAIKSDSPTLKGEKPETPMPDPDEVIEKAVAPLMARIDTLEALLIEKQGRVLAQKHVDALSSAHQIIGDVIDAAVHTSSPDGKEDEPEKSANRPDHTPNAAAKTKARLMELSPRKGAHS